MARVIIVGDTVDSFVETSNFEFPLPDQNVHGATLLQALKEAITEIDTELNTVKTTSDAATTDISAIEADIASIESSITTINNTKANIRPMPTTATITRDGNGNITFYQTAEETLNNFVYTSDVLNSYRSTVNGVTYQVNITRDGNDDITSIAVVTI